jgi:crossover junction endodeoxyribonuclease RuvC
MIRVLGIDCGSNVTGFGIIDSDGRSYRVVESGVVLAAARLPFSERLKIISDRLRALIQSHSPEVMAVEEVFYSVNVKSLIKLAHVKGVVLLVGADAGLAVHEYSALEVKRAVVGYGRAEKSQVQQMVQLLLGLKEAPPEDAADALAVALCHANRAQTMEKLSRSSSSRPSAVPISQPPA